MIPKPNSSGASGVIAEVDIADLERRAEARFARCPKEAADDSLKSYDLAHRVLREHKVRRGDWPPINAEEECQLAEGPRDYAELDAVRNG